jgi:hypothetical protein
LAYEVEVDEMVEEINTYVKAKKHTQNSSWKTEKENSLGSRCRGRDNDADNNNNSSNNVLKKEGFASRRRIFVGFKIASCGGPF